jgi:DNA-binding response OmpR family regulator
MKKKLLIVEDEIDIVRLIENRLDTDLFTIDFALDGRQAMDCILTNTYDLVTLDIMLPKVDGMKICSHLHRYMPSAFIIVISALTGESQKIKAYEMGADCYIPKPFSPRVLASRIMAFFRRSQTPEHVVQHHAISLKDDYFQLEIDGHSLQLTPSEYLIFTTLFRNRRMAFSRLDLAALIYEHGQGEIGERGIDSHIAHIRKKLQPFGQKELIETVRGKGYVINAH